MTTTSTDIKVGDKVLLSFWAGQQSEMVGTIEAIQGCDGNGCEKHAAENRYRMTDAQRDAAMLADPCDQDYVALVEDRQMIYFRFQVAEVNGDTIEGGGG